MCLFFIESNSRRSISVAEQTKRDRSILTNRFPSRFSRDNRTAKLSSPVDVISVFFQSIRTLFFSLFRSTDEGTTNSSIEIDGSTENEAARSFSLEFSSKGNQTKVFLLFVSRDRRISSSIKYFFDKQTYSIQTDGDHIKQEKRSTLIVARLSSFDLCATKKTLSTETCRCHRFSL